MFSTSFEPHHCLCQRRLLEFCGLRRLGRALTTSSHPCGHQIDLYLALFDSLQNVILGQVKDACSIDVVDFEIGALLVPDFQDVLISTKMKKNDNVPPRLSNLSKSMS